MVLQNRQGAFFLKSVYHFSINSFIFIDFYCIGVDCGLVMGLDIPLDGLNHSKHALLIVIQTDQLIRVNHIVFRVLEAVKTD